MGDTLHELISLIEIPALDKETQRLINMYLDMDVWEDTPSTPATPAPAPRPARLAVVEVTGRLFIED